MNIYYNYYGDYMEVLLVLSVLPSILLGNYIYKKDSIEKESTGLLVKCVFGGILAVVAVIVLSIILQLVFPVLQDDTDYTLFQKALECFIEIALVEEGFKLLFLRLFTWKDKEYSHLFDGIVYSVFIAIGFATLENIMYIFSTQSLFVAILRALCSVPGHIFFGIYMGYYYGQAKRASLYGKNKDKNIYMIKALLLPTLLHGFFDFCLLSESIVLFFIYLIFVITLYILAFKKIKKVSNEDSILFITNSYCTNCGCLINLNFCPNCGTKKSI